MLYTDQLWRELVAGFSYNKDVKLSANEVRNADLNFAHIIQASTFNADNSIQTLEQ